jgi:hypothetical protein
VRAAELQVLVGAVAPSPLGADLVDAIENVQATQTSGARGGFQLTFRLPPHGPLATDVLPVGSLDAPTRVVLVLTLHGQPTVLADGVVTRHDVTPATTAGAGRLTVTGVDLSQLMDLIDLSGVPMPAMPLSAQALFLLARYAPFGIVPTVLPTPLVDVPNPLDRIPAQQGTDYAHLRRIAAAVGYVFELVPGPVPGMSTAYWGPTVRQGSPQPPLLVGFGPDRNVEDLTVGFDGTKRTLYAAWFLEPNSRVPIPVPIPDVSPLSPPLGGRMPPPLRFRQLNRIPGRDDEAPSRVGVTTTIMRGMARAAADADAVTGSGSLDVARYGGLLAARRLVDVRGAGLAYDGTWFVTSTTTSVSRGELTQRFQLVRNALTP